METDQRFIRKLLIDSFSRDELITLATDITGNAELVFSNGGTLETWARELTDWCKRRSKTILLLEHIKDRRPDALSKYEMKSEKSTERKQVLSKAKISVFLCHSSQDKPVVREVCRRLKSENWIDPWLDEEKLLPGMDWNMAIEMAVEAADAVLVFLSNNSVTKEGYVQRELKYALDIALEKPEGTIFVIPVRLEDCQPPRRLRSWQYVDFFPLDKKEWAFHKLIDSLKTRANT